MCLNANCNQLKPTEDKVYYKVVTRKDRRSPYHSEEYPVGKTVKAVGIPDWDCNLYLHGGAIHVFTDDRFASVQGSTDSRSCVGNSYWLLIKVLCRKEHFIAIGRCYDAAYSQVEVLD